MREQFRLIAVGEVLEAAASSVASQPVYGLVRRAERLVQILGSESRDGDLDLVGRIVTGDVGNRSRCLRLQAGGRSVILALTADTPTPEVVEVVSLADSMESRTAACLGNATLRDRRIVLVGAGSVGSMMGLLLAEAGVGMFSVHDNDVLDATNLCRHACDLRDLGRAKALAVADLLRRRGARADWSASDLLGLEPDQLRALVAGADLVIASTDSVAAQLITNETCVAVGTPALFVGAHERACSGEIVLVRPGGPCLFCAVGFRAGLAGDVSVKERRLAYQAADANRLEAEPGLGADIAYLVATAAAYALAVLDPAGTRVDLLEPERAFTLVHSGSRPRDAYAELFQAPFDLVTAHVRRETACPVCGYVSAGNATDAR